MKVPMDLFTQKQCEILEFLANQENFVPEEYFCMDGNFYGSFRKKRIFKHSKKNTELK